MIEENSYSLPSVEEAAAAAVEIVESVKPELTIREQAFFIAGFKECIKWLSVNNQQ